MKRLLIILTVAVLGAAVGVATAQRSNQYVPPPSTFKIYIEATSYGVELRCEKGCAWETLKWGCDGNLPCGSSIDQMGMTK